MKYFIAKLKEKLEEYKLRKVRNPTFFPFPIYSTWESKSIYSTFKIERFVCENKKCLTKLSSRLIDIFCMSKHEVNNDGSVVN